MTECACCVIASHAIQLAFISRQQGPIKVTVAVKTIALGSDRAAKIMAVRASVARVATIDPDWANANVVARRVETNVPAMPLTDWQLMQGARERALAARDSLAKSKARS